MIRAFSFPFPIASRRWLRESHPDRPGGDTRKQQQINAAYQLLSKRIAA
jgi:hypothetical protein